MKAFVVVVKIEIIKINIKKRKYMILFMIPIIILRTLVCFEEKKLSI